MVMIKEFYGKSIEAVLEDCKGYGYKVMYLPKVVDERIRSNRDARIWGRKVTTPSIKASGTTKKGNKVVVYAHVPNHFSKPSNLREVRKNLTNNNRAPFPKAEFYKLLSLEDGKSVFVLDRKQHMSSNLKFLATNGRNIDKAIGDPLIIAHLGGEERARRYIEKLESFGNDHITIWDQDDFYYRPVASLLCLEDILLGGAPDHDLLNDDEVDVYCFGHKE